MCRVVAGFRVEREVLQRDVDRERRLRLDTEVRLRDCTAEAERCRARLHALQRELSRMEDSMRSMLQYKARSEQLKQEKTSLTVAYENRIHQFQNTLVKLGNENEALRKQLRALEAAGAGEVQTALLERLRVLENDNCSLSRDAEVQRRQYERCLDDVANQVVRALLSQKGLREEIGTLQRRIKDLEAQNRALTAVLVQQLQPQATPSPASMNVLLPGLCSATPSPDTPATSLSTPSSGALWEDMSVEPLLWLPVTRPRSLPLGVGTSSGAVSLANSTTKCCQHRRSRPLLATATSAKKTEDVGSESPESGNRDEGYSTMSSDVQAEAAPKPLEAAGAGLEDVKEASDETETVADVRPINSGGCLLVVEDACDPDVLYIPLGLTVGINPRHSFPPAKDLLPYQHIMRSFSDSHLCLKITPCSPCAPFSACSLASSASSSPSVLALEAATPASNLAATTAHPLRRTKATVSLSSAAATSSQNNEIADDDEAGVWWDSDYVQHWLKLDETRGALQQQHRDMLELEYDQAELEDWSMSCDDFAPVVEGNTGNMWRRDLPQALPSIQENNQLELEEDTNDYQWNSSSHLSSTELMTLLLDVDQKNYWQNNNYGLSSPGGSWSSNSEDCCHSYDCSYAAGCESSSKRSSAAMSGCSDDAVSSESPAVGTDFTRDFYRLVKFESTKSLASTSSRSLVDNGGSLKRNQELLQTAPDREQALQSVLTFIAEQQQYCTSREEEDLEVTVQPTPLLQDENQNTVSKGSDDDDLNEENCASEMNDSNSHEADHESCCSKPSLDLETSTNDEDDIISVVSNPGATKPRTDEAISVSPEHCIDNENSIVVANESCSQGCAAAETFQDRNYFKTKQQNVEISVQNGHSGDFIDGEMDKASENVYSQASGAVSLGARERNCAIPLGENDIAKSSNRKQKCPESLLNQQNDTAHKNMLNSLKDEAKSEVDSFDLNRKSMCATAKQDSSLSCNTNSGSEQSSNIKDCNSYDIIASNSQSLPNFPIHHLLPSSADDSVKTKSSQDGAFGREGCTGDDEYNVPAPKEVMLKDMNIASYDYSRAVHSSGRVDTLMTVIEEDEQTGGMCREMSESLTSTVSTPDTVVNRLQCDNSPNSVLIMDASAVSFHEHATSKDVIEELNRMIRKGEDGISGSENDVTAVGASKLDVACCCPTGWVHVERDIDFTDPKARANLLDVMLASSGSSGGSSNSGNSSNSSSCSESGDEPADYQHLHRLHRFRRQKKASATRDQLGVLRYPASAPRPSIIGRDDFFVRYGEKEREAVASFDFLEEMSTTSVSGASSCDTLGSRKQLPAASGQHATTPTPNVSPTSDESDEKVGGPISFSDSCAASFSGSSNSLETPGQ
ncbi:uncharacterized protein LOC124776545 [Schistocerca piceifrons]|uniref:uncharacterized protein LOC124776545 n=1 Tax=Schistocerca piceifrons TaxID=274613 RepID=UPI001F5EBB79|nr:uncharacterized protein LOC124776545 [Schistocerca piceifrons]